MNAHLLTLACAIALTLPAMNKAYADSAVYPGNLDRASY